ncbi:MAG: hypothetical protein QM756_01920 [Polyangiaceae bacterium]
MLSKSSIVRVASLVALLTACASDSGEPAGNGGSGSGSGGSSSTGNGGSTSTGNGGSTATGNGGSTSTGNGGSTTTGNGGSTSTGNGGATSTTNGGSTTASGGASTSNGGSTTSSGGASTTSGGSTTTSGGSTTTSGGAAGGAAAMPCPDGCAQLSVPFTAWKSAQQFEIYLASAVDLTGATINVKIRKVSGKAGGVQIICKHKADDTHYPWAQSAWNGLTDLTTDWKTITMLPSMPGSATTDTAFPFDPTKVTIITVQLNAGGAWYTDTAMTMEDPTALVNPTVVQVDEISITGATGTPPGPWTFATATDTTMTLKANLDAAGQTATPPWAVAGSTVTWVGP